MVQKDQTYFDITVKTFQGFESILVDELKALGAKQITAEKRSVNFKGDLKMLYKANLHLRTATKVLVPIASFKAFNEIFFQKKVMEIDWSKYLTSKDTFYIDTNVMSKFLRNPASLTQKVKDSILGHFRKKDKPQPVVKAEDPDLRLNLHVFNEMVVLALDSSGEFLFKRAYWAEKPESYVNEVLSAGLILMSGWDKKTFFLDPMCGSASLVFEAALIANNIAPNIYANSFGFMKWKDFDKYLWDEVVKEAKAGELHSIVKILGYDASPSAIKLAKKNQRYANLLGKVDFEVQDVFDMDMRNEKGFMILIPPATERIGKFDIYAYYSKLGNLLKTKFSNFTVCMLCPDQNALQTLNFKPVFKKTLLNGKIESYFEKYLLYKSKIKEDDF